MTSLYAPAFRRSLAVSTVVLPALLGFGGARWWLAQKDDHETPVTTAREKPGLASPPPGNFEPKPEYPEDKVLAAMRTGKTEAANLFLELAGADGKKQEAL